MLAVGTTDSLEKLLYGYTINKCDSVRFPLISIEGGARAVGEAFDLIGKAGPTLLIKPDKTVIRDLYYSKWAIRKDFKNNGIDSATCSDTIDVPTAVFYHPQRDEKLLPGDNFTISWGARDPNGIKTRAIYFSHNDGKEWTLIDSSNTSDTTFTWKVPDINSNRCRFKLHLYDNLGFLGKKISIYCQINGATKITSVINIKGTDILFLNNRKQLKIVSPNSIVSYSIVKANGQIITHNRVHNISNAIVLSPGIYFVSLKTQNGFIYKKRFHITP